MLGQILGHYEILEKLGAGGMGEVYRARDTKLGGDVAIKVLPAAFAPDPERLARLVQDVKLLASLNHPNVGAIYGLEESGGTRFLVVELVPGETLAQRLARRRPEVEEALKICAQVAEALEAAHEKGIIHGDLKPANIKVRREGKVKVLDFGLARAFVGTADLSRLATGSVAETRQGAILSTASHMSPELAHGRPLDKRTDIWSFGCILYETLTGRQAFRRETVTDTLAAVLEHDPDWEALPTSTPARIRELLRRCLQKDPRRRLRDIGDARLEIEEALAEPWRELASISAAAVIPPPVARRRTVLWVLTGLLVGALAGGGVAWDFMRKHLPARGQPVRLVMSLPATEPLETTFGRAISLSPDGRQYVYVARRGNTTQLYLRAMDQLEAKPIPGTEGAQDPFFSPDAHWLGFRAEGKLKKVLLHGGTPITLCEGAHEPLGASWGPNNNIVFAPTYAAGLARVSASGGTPQALTSMDSAGGDRGHLWPEILPGGKAVLFTSWTGASFDDAYIGLVSLETGQRRVLARGGTLARYAPSGHIVFARGGALLAVPFDLSRLEVRGSPVTVLEGVMMNPTNGAAQYDFSHDGSLVYVPQSSQAAERALVSVNRQGAAQMLTEERRAFGFPRLSPDGRHLAVTIREATNRSDIWVYELARGTLTRLTSEGENFMPLWTPDGKRVTFSSTRAGTYNLFLVSADGSGAPGQLARSVNVQFPGSWSPDGRTLAFCEIDPFTRLDIWVLSMEGEPKPGALVRSPADELAPVFSPDGRWLAYVSNESGRFEVYVQPFPGPGGKWQISTEGGTEPVWAPNGRELFYRNGSKLVMATVQTKPAFSASKPQLLFEGQYEAAEGFFSNYDITRDGQRFVMLRRELGSAPTQVNVVLNWFEDLKRRVGAGKR